MKRKDVLEAQFDRLLSFYYAQLKTLEFYEEIGDTFNYELILKQCEEVKEKLGELAKDMTF